MNTITHFYYSPNEYESEKASNSYLMSLIAVIAGLPFPIINLIATFAFYLGNRKGTYFVRWHCTQALLSQFSLLLMNSVAFWWSVTVLFGSENLSNSFIAYLITVFLFNLTEFAATIYSTINTRKGLHVKWWFYGDLTNMICSS
ncbi:MAG: hypothetical protein COW63_11475 [Bacteroidetes bacterium CG18_big_fil_WC_8_21_14_2_50_41_14]|nr:MAG: hypothetical protein COW63_11475 [Bacteroidetes bacterium CG18_big_fil_WC_8_21_14_2_50_41_14]PJB56872.1 MAG: hypothetical protein CO098_12765 [Bacteroidetes bacterium CG_4_9_14_3_um_filter_41_19]